MGMTNRIIFTQEMIDDLSKIGDKEFSEKWKVSRPLIIRRRRELGILPFNNQHGTREHKFEGGIELKYCPSGGGHWAKLNEFTKCGSRYDGLRGVCSFHSSQRRRETYPEKDLAGKARIWRKTPTGKKSLRLTWRKETAKKNGAYVLWEKIHEENAYDMFGRSCAYCGIRVDFLKIEFDHFIPISSGGKTEPGNMVPCCVKCNRGAGGKFSRDAWEWLQSKFGLERAGYIYNYCREKLHHLQMKHQNS
jgi:5-methylcytosine-specific restriction endonuclease McrA